MAYYENAPEKESLYTRPNERTMALAAVGQFAMLSAVRMIMSANSKISAWVALAAMATWQLNRILPAVPAFFARFLEGSPFGLYLSTASLIGALGLEMSYVGEYGQQPLGKAALGRLLAGVIGSVTGMLLAVRVEGGGWNSFFSAQR